MDEIRRYAREAIADVVPACPEFYRQVRRIVTRLIAVPYRLIDGNAIDMRAFVEIDLSCFANSTASRGNRQYALRRRLGVDLFDPPQRAAYRVAEIP